MFTGIVTDIGEVLEVAERAQGLRGIAIGCRYDRSSIAVGASIACAGVCLTVIEIDGAQGRTIFRADTAAETLAVTTAGRWKVGTRLNLEQALKLGDELGGHLVNGHVDGIATLIERDDLPDMARMRFRAPPLLSRFIAQKGSVAIDGVSLTINDVDRDTLSVLIIPHTLAVTTLGEMRVGDAANLEVDLMARYAARLLEQR